MYKRQLGKLAKARALWAELRRREREGHTPAVRALWELVRLHRRNGVSPMFYLLAGLYRRELSWEDKLAYVGKERVKEYLDRINPPAQQYLARNKVVSHGVLTTFSIPTPPFYGLVGKKRDAAPHAPVLRDPDDLFDVLDRHGIDTVCFKHVSGTRGRGFYKVAIDRSGPVAIARVLPGGGSMPVEELWRELTDTPLFDGYFCQGVVDQHPDVARFNPWSLNTARCWMVRGDDGAWFMYDAVFRMGCGETSVDNISAGGIVSPIDVSSGRLGDAVTEEIERRIRPDHPVTGVRFSGEALPMWSEAVALCLRAAAHFPYDLVAVDVAFAVDTPTIIELGATPDQHQVRAGHGVGPMLEHLLTRRLQS